MGEESLTQPTTRRLDSSGRWSARSCGKFGIGRGFVPTHPGYREIVLAARIGACFPCRRAWASGGISKLGDTVLPRKSPSILQEGMLPIFVFPVTAFADEFGELPVRDFIFVDEEVLQGRWHEMIEAE